MIAKIVTTNRQSKENALICICSAHQDVIKAAFSFLQKNPTICLSIESTVQQVNQDGGYTGMVPKDYVAMVYKIAEKYNIPKESYILAGDHLGPNAWKHLAAEEAMKKSLVLVEEYVKAGYTKIHIDPSMSCSDDPTPLSIATIAERTAMMVEVAEKTAIATFGNSDRLFYVVGTEVPVPGGSQEFEDHISITPPHEVEETIRLIKEAFDQYNLSPIWNKVRGIVVQPGVEFGDDFVFLYKKDNAKALIDVITPYPNLVYEAHSTDYQTTLSLNGLVQDHFGILKVGPELTFAWREALFALDMIEKENPAISLKSNLRDTVDKEMLENPTNWAPYYKGTDVELSFKRIYSLSDRIRYYWASPTLTEAVDKAIPNYNKALSYSLVSQYLPWVLEYNEKNNKTNFSAQEILIWSVERIIQKYFNATKNQ